MTRRGDATRLSIERDRFNSGTRRHRPERRALHGFQIRGRRVRFPPGLPFRGRLTVGRGPLDPTTQVRILPPEPRAYSSTVECLFYTQEVDGSNPSGPTTCFGTMAGSSGVERFRDKEEVGGSSPPQPTNGSVAHLGERWLRKLEVESSSLFGSTTRCTRVVTNDKVRSILRGYIAKLEDVGVAAKQFDRFGKRPGERASCEHALTMCHTAITMLDEAEEANHDKAMRWLGFVQGVLWAAGAFSIDELRNDNRSQG